MRQQWRIAGRIAGRLVDLALLLYPASFRAEFGEQIRATFRDLCADAWRRRRAWGLLLLIAPTLLDLFCSALDERVRQVERIMSKTTLTTYAAPLTIFAGLLGLLSSLGEFVLLTGLATSDSLWDAFWLLLIFLSLVPLLIAQLATLVRYSPAAGIAGKVGLSLALAAPAGILLLLLAAIFLTALAPALDQGSWARWVEAAFFLSLGFGYLLFGIDSLRRKLLPRWNGLPLLVAAATLFRFAPTLFDLPNYHPLQLTSYFLHLAFTGACLILLGYAMLDPRRNAQLHLPA